MPTFSRIFTNLMITLLFLLGNLLLWIACMILAFYAAEFATMEHYSQDKKANPNFQILIQDEQGIRPVRLEKWQAKQILMRQESAAYNQDGNGYRLQQIAPDTYKLFADLDTAMMTQTYRITPNNHIEPLSFRTINIATGLLAFPLSFVFLVFSKWLLGFFWRKWRRNRKYV